MSATQADGADGAAALLRTTTAVRDRAGFLLRRARAGESPWFVVDDDSTPVNSVPS